MPKTTKSKRVVAYLRVSTEDQAVEGVSLEAQERKARTWCDLHGHSRPQIHRDAGVSGKRADNRPGLQAALKAVCRSRGVLIVYSLSRMARSTKDAIEIAERLQRAGADLVSLSESIDTRTAAGRFFFVVLAALAQMEREVTGERTAAALAHLKAEGRRVSRHAPFGFVHVDGRLVEDDREQQAVARMHELRAEGLSIRKVAAALEDEGHVNRAGNRLGIKTVHRVLAEAAA